MKESALQKSISGLVKTFKFSLSFLSKEDKRKYLMSVSLSIVLNLMDIFGVFLLGLFGTLAIRGIQSQPQGDTVNSILNLLGLDSFSFQVQALSISTFAVLVLTSKSYLSLILNRKIFNFLALRSAKVSTDMFERAYLKDLQFINKISFQELRHSTNYAIYSLITGILGAVAVLTSDLILLSFLCIAIGFFDLLSLTLVFTFFSISAVALLGKQFRRAKRIGQEATKFSIAADGLLYDGINLYREYYVRNLRGKIVTELKSLKTSQALVMGQQSFLPNVGKYIIESTVLIGIVLVSGIQFLLHDANTAVAGVAIFISSAARIAPALMRIQQNLTQISISLGETVRVRSLIDDINLNERDENPYNYVEGLEICSTNIEIENLEFKFTQASNFEIKINKLSIPANSTLALIGPSGAGKTSLADLILGVLPAPKGSITIGGLTPSDAVRKNPNLISYVPQRVQLLNASLYENIVLSTDKNAMMQKRVEDVLRMSDLLDWVETLPNGLETIIGTGGIIPSGGQAQRIGIARAFFVNPKIIVLDEATSAIDYESEEKIKKTIERAKGTMTIITIAHRLSTVKSAELIVVMENGKLSAQGDYQGLLSTSDYFKQILKSLKN